MRELRNEYLTQITNLKKLIAEIQQQKDHRKTLNIMFPTADLDAKMADKRRKLKRAQERYKETYNV